MIANLPEVQNVLVSVGLSGSYASSISQEKADAILAIERPTLFSVRTVLDREDPAPPKPKPKTKTKTTPSED